MNKYMRRKLVKSVFLLRRFIDSFWCHDKVKTLTNQ